jgi:hypothetical protein
MDFPYQMHTTNDNAKLFIFLNIYFCIHHFVHSQMMHEAIVHDVENRFEFKYLQSSDLPPTIYLILQR